MTNRISNVQGALQDVYGRIVRGTGRHVDELIRDRIESGRENLRFHAVDGQLFRLDEQGKLQWIITRGEANPFFQDLGTFCEQLRQTDDNPEALPKKAADFHPPFYTPTEEQVRKALEATSTVVINLGEIRINKTTLAFGVENLWNGYDSDMHSEQRKALDRLFGSEMGLLEYWSRVLCQDPSYLTTLNPDNSPMHPFVHLPSPNFLMAKIKEHGTIGMLTVLMDYHGGSDIFVDNLCYSRVLPEGTASKLYLRGIISEERHARIEDLIL